MIQRILKLWPILFSGLTLLILAILPVFLLYGWAWISIRILPVFSWIIAIWVILMPIVVGALSCWGKTRELAATISLISSFCFGVFVWMWALLITLSSWGIWAVLLGLMMFGFGVVPMALLASLLQKDWSIFVQLVCLAALSVGTQIYSVWLRQKIDLATPELQRSEFQVSD
jgi:hypothetical protein